MFRQLVGLVLLTLAAFGLSPAQADTFYPYAGAPKLEVYAVDDSDSTNLQPSVSYAASRTSYTIRVEALTNGSLDEIEVIALCFYSAGNVPDVVTCTTMTRADIRQTRPPGAVRLIRHLPTILLIFSLQHGPQPRVSERWDKPPHFGQLLLLVYIHSNQNGGN